MLIELEVKIKLPVIVFFILYDGVLVKFVDVIFDKQRMPKDSHDLNDWATDLMIMFNDGNETVRDDGHVYLNTNCILGFSPKSLDPKMLFDPLKEQFDLPSIYIKECNFTCFEVEIVRIVCERSLQFWSIIDNAPEIGIFVPRSARGTKRDKKMVPRVSGAQTRDKIDFLAKRKNH